MKALLTLQAEPLMALLMRPAKLLKVLPTQLLKRLKEVYSQRHLQGVLVALKGFNALPLEEHEVREYKLAQFAQCAAHLPEVDAKAKQELDALVAKWSAVR